MAKTFQELVGEVRSRIREVGPEEARSWMESEPRLLVLDVREPDEVRRAHIRGAHVVPRGLLEPKAAPDSPARDPELDPERPVLVYCGSGVRSALAADVLQTFGYRDVRSLAGGISAWQTDGFPVES